MTVEFVKAHTGKDGKNYTAGQIADISNNADVQELIRQGVAKERKAGDVSNQPQPTDR